MNNNLISNKIINFIRLTLNVPVSVDFSEVLDPQAIFVTSSDFHFNFYSLNLI